MWKWLVAHLLPWMVGQLPRRDRDALQLYAAVKPLEPARRSSLWPAVRRAHLLLEPRCQLCGNAVPGELEVHHIQPFHTHPERELDPTNLVTLCERSPSLKGINCHLWVGHLGAWRSINPRVMAFVQRLGPLLRDE